MSSVITQFQSKVNFGIKYKSKPMVKVKSFSGYIAHPDLASEIVSRPYDVITRKQAQTLSNSKPHSYYHVIRPEITLPDQIDEHDQAVYQLGRKNLERFIDNGYLTRDPIPRIYVYQTLYKGFVSTGFFLLISVDEYERCIVKKHELTRQDKELDRTHLIDIQDSNAEPILVSYRDVHSIEELLHGVVGTDPQIKAHTLDDDAYHRLWLLSEQQSKFVEQEFATKVESLYIADGHHRMAASMNVAKQRRQAAKQKGIELTGQEPYEFTLAYVVSSRCLNICGYHRVIKSLNHKSSSNILEQISQSFDLVPIYEGRIEPTKKGDFSILVEKQWFKMSIKHDAYDRYVEKHPQASQQLDVQILQELCITPIFEIQDIRSDPNIEFVGGIDGVPALEHKVLEEGCAVAIACFPVSVEDVYEIADQNEIMMPKSTWIVPKPRSGLVMRTFQ